MDTTPSPTEYENRHVHEVYQEIAHHFSSTRYKPWPVVERFLLGLSPGSVGLDVGCGNGKYLSVNPNVFILASDRSESLVKIAATHAANSAVVADALFLPFLGAFFDFAISVAVVHHLSTRHRRVEAIQAMLATLRTPVSDAPPAHALIFVWALEQKSSRRGWDEGDEQDVMVPWVRKGDPGFQASDGAETFHRYYHLYRRGELEQDVLDAGGIIAECGYEKDNWWAIAARRPIE